MSPLLIVVMIEENEGRQKKRKRRKKQRGKRKKERKKQPCHSYYKLCEDVVTEACKATVKAPRCPLKEVVKG